MGGWRWLRGLVLASAFGLGGCPMVLNDDFSVDQGRAGAGAGGNASAGSQPVQGGEPTMSDAGAPDSGGGASGNRGGGPQGGMPGGGNPPLAGGAGEGGMPPLAGCGACDGPDEACCDDVCVDTSVDENNCRTCGHGCPGTTCVDASCTNTCLQGFVDCNHNIVDGCEVNPAIDPGNCGNCGIICGFQLECVAGYCVCPAGTADCDGDKTNGCERDLLTDAGHCGGCGKACDANEACSGGLCDCHVGFLDCNGTVADGCEAPVTANDSCGSCDVDCGLHGLCVGEGACGCQPGYLDCDLQVPGCETAISDPSHCGACDVQCPASSPACDGVRCSAGCGALTKCGASCVDTLTDPGNCGACGNVVGTGQTCVGGKPTCVAGYANCDSNPNDCEVNTQNDAAHCGGCGTTCKSGALCNGGSCECAPTTPNDCGSSCKQCCNDGQCSDGNSCTADVCTNGSCSFGGTCGSGGKCCAGTGCFECCSDADCDGTKVCSNNRCVTLTCMAPKIACGLKCVDPTNDPQNCGACGLSCGAGRTCAKGACTPKWSPMANPPAGFVAREKAAHAAMGSKVFIWGGNDASSDNLADGAIYDPETNTWVTLPLGGTPPSARILATAVWTGSVMVVWGGGDATGNADYASGSRFDPATNSWTAMTTVGAPAGRRGPYGFWTGSRVLFFGGVDKAGNALAGASLYDPLNDKWTIASTGGQPNARTDPAIGWSGNELIVEGGRTGANNYSNATYAYNPANDKWATRADGPSNRHGAFSAWTGSQLLAWSGAAPALQVDGKLFEPVGNKWTTMGALGQPSARYVASRMTGWTARTKAGSVLLLGGRGAMAASYFTDGGIYNSTTNAWAPIANWPSGASHWWGVAVWTGSEMVLWSGRTTTTAALTNAGERFLP